MRLLLWAVLLCMAVMHTANAQEDGVKRYPALLLADEVVINSFLPEEEQFASVLETGLANTMPSRRVDVPFTSIVQPGLTGADILSQMDAIYAHRPRIAVVVLGYGQALKAVDTRLIYNELDQLLETLKQHYMYVLLVGSRAPESADIAYASRFNAMYSELATRHQVTLYPDIFQGLRDKNTTFAPGTQKPTAQGIAAAAENLNGYLSKMVHALRKASSF